VVGDAQEAEQFDFDSGFFAGFTDGALLQAFQKVHFSADDAPAAGFWGALAQGEENAVLRIDQEYADTDSRDFVVVLVSL